MCLCLKQQVGSSGTGVCAWQVSSAGSDCSGVTGFSQFAICSIRKRPFPAVGPPFRDAWLLGRCDVGTCQKIMNIWVFSSVSQLKGAAVVGWGGQRWELFWNSGVLEKALLGLSVLPQFPVQGWKPFHSQPAQEVWAICLLPLLEGPGHPWDPLGEMFSLHLWSGSHPDTCAWPETSAELKDSLAQLIQHTLECENQNVPGLLAWVEWGHLFMNKLIVSLLLLQQEDFTMFILFSSNWEN